MSSSKHYNFLLYSIYNIDLFYHTFNFFTIFYDFNDFCIKIEKYLRSKVHSFVN